MVEKLVLHVVCKQSPVQEPGSSGFSSHVQLGWRILSVSFQMCKIFKEIQITEVLLEMNFLGDSDISESLPKEFSFAASYM